MQYSKFDMNHSKTQQTPPKQVRGLHGTPYWGSVRFCLAPSVKCHLRGGPNMGLIEVRVPDSPWSPPPAESGRADWLDSPRPRHPGADVRSPGAPAGLRSAKASTWRKTENQLPVGRSRKNPNSQKKTAPGSKTRNVLENVLWRPFGKQSSITPSQM